MRANDHRISTPSVLSRRYALALLGGAGLAAVTTRHSFAVSPDFAAFNRRYIAEVVVPRFTRLSAVCAKWHGVIARMAQEPSAGKASLMNGGDEIIWDAWTEAEPFMTLLQASQSRDDSLAAWVQKPDELADEVGALLAKTDADDLAPVRVGETSLGRHCLAAMELLLDGEGKGRDIARDFYLAESGPRRTALLAAVVRHMAVKADAAAATWAAIGRNGLLAGSSAQETASRFLTDQLDFLNDIVFIKMKVEPRLDIDLVRPSAIEARLGARIMSNLQAFNDAARSPAGFESLLPDSDAGLRAKLRDACATTLNLAHQSVALGYPLPRYTGLFFTTMCCFSPCPPQEELDKKAEERNEENRLRVEALRVQIISLRNLLQTDFATAIGLSSVLRKT